MASVYSVLSDMVIYVLKTLVHNAPALVLGIIVAGAIRVYVNPESMREWLARKASASIPATVAFGAFTPFCACGTMAVVVSMLATALPWGPIMAFLTSSPLMSPEDFVLYAGILGKGFAIALTVTSIVIGLGSGYLTHLLEMRTRLLDGQARFADPEESSCSCSGSEPLVAAASDCGCGCSAEVVQPSRPVASQSGCGCSAEAVQPSRTITSQSGCGCSSPAEARVETALPSKTAVADRLRLTELFRTVVQIGFVQILPYFAMFAGIGFLINKFVPSEWIMTLFSGKNPFAIPLAALIGLPLYVTGPSSIPLIKALLAGGASGGAMLAFMVTGPGTSAGVIAGITTIMRRRAVALYVTYVLVGGVVAGYAYDFILRLR